MKPKKKYLFHRLTALLIFVLSIISVCVYGTYAWIKVSSERGIYPFYNVEMSTPTDSFYVKVEVAVDEIYNEETNDFDVIYEDIDKVDFSTKLVYPGDRLNFRFLVYNFGGQDTSISIYFKDIIDTKVSDTTYLSQDIILGSPSFNGNDGKVNDSYGFLFYAGEKMNYGTENLTSVEIENTVCSNGEAECYLNNSNVRFANNVNIKASEFNDGYTKAYFDSQMEIIKESSDNFEQDRRNLVYETYVPTELNWYMLLDRESTIETANSLFRIGTILFAVD